MSRTSLRPRQPLIFGSAAVLAITSSAVGPQQIPLPQKSASFELREPAGTRSVLRRDGGTISLSFASTGTPMAITDPEQWYYWTSEWQRSEQVAIAELVAGDFVEFDSADDLLAWLHEPE